MGKLTALGVSREKKPGLYGDGDNLWLQVSASGAKSWLFRYRFAGKQREMGLGSITKVGLAEARDAAEAARKMLGAGVDPLEARKAAKADALVKQATATTFEMAAERYIRSKGPGWKSAKHAAQWSSTLETYAYPAFGELPVAAITTGLVVDVLQPIWHTKNETASRLRGRIEAVLDAAKVRGERDGENPARWRGHLDKLLPARKAVHKVKHHPALPYGEIGPFMRRLEAMPGVAAKALRFVILTAARTGEAVDARWEEFDLERAVWTIPPGRMKSQRVHDVPLSPAVVDLLQEMLAAREGASPYVFPGQSSGRPLSNMALLKLLERMGRVELTVHGFRSTFRDWAAETTAYPNELVELALAHVIKDKAEAAYRRGTQLEKRRRLMAEWAIYCAREATTTADVVPIRG